MKHIKHVSIPQPCNQNWVDMDIDAQGRFCQSCQKTVTDFTSLSNAEIINILSSTSTKICGRFNDTQLLSLNRDIAIPEITHQPSSLFAWQKLSIAAAFIGFVPFIKTEAKTRPPVEYRPILFKKPVAQTTDTTKEFRTITGSVTDSLGEVLPNVVIRINGTQFKTLTDRYGQFRLAIPAATQLIGQVVYIGFTTQEFKLDHQVNNYSFVLKEANKMMGEIVVLPAKQPVPTKKDQ